MMAPHADTVPIRGLSAADLAPSRAGRTSCACGAGPTGGKSPTRQRLDKLLDEMADSELLAMFFVGKRVQKGRKKYGVLNPFDTKTEAPDWLEMGAEELADLFVYMAAEVERRRVLD